MSVLGQSLEGFCSRANANQAVKRLSSEWRLQLHLHPLDETNAYQLQLLQGQMSSCVASIESDDSALLLRGNADVLASIFSGQLHPLAAYNNGDLEVYGPHADQIKLDALSLVIWGA